MLPDFAEKVVAEATKQGATFINSWTPEKRTKFIKCVVKRLVFAQSLPVAVATCLKDFLK